MDLSVLDLVSFLVVSHDAILNAQVYLPWQVFELKDASQYDGSTMVVLWTGQAHESYTWIHLDHEAY
jgi:hypothetical protein